MVTALLPNEARPSTVLYVGEMCWILLEIAVSRGSCFARACDPMAVCASTKVLSTWFTVLKLLVTNQQRRSPIIRPRSSYQGRRERAIIDLFGVFVTVHKTMIK